MRYMLQSLLFWGFVLASSLLLFPSAVVIWAVTLPFDRRRLILHRFTCLWASLYTWTNPAWPVQVQGREKLVDDRACVMVANHLSLLDILVLFRLFSHFKWVSKLENFRVPLIGWNMRLNRYIPLRRGDRVSVYQMMRLCEETLAGGSSIMMFPEGTRSPHGRLRRFKTGAFELAKKTGSPIQPIVIRGTADALPKRGFVLQGRHPISLTVLDAIAPERFADLSVEELTLHVHAIIAAETGDAAALEANPETAAATL
ncbi:MAG: 1-acyl-sn-glycerol-3-phosphate acyltransferase [Deltaproteobacteria bacterium]|nr:1-acyl-sn-glycerol-3-phosphate acyltransferase [Deltaproteobacteria bacterium]